MNTTDFASLNSFVSLNKWKKIDRFSGAMLNMTHRLFFCSHRNYIHSVSHESSNFYLFFLFISTVVHLTSSWCLHYRAVLAAHIEHQAAPYCRGAICWRLGSGSDFTDIFHTSRWCYQSDMAVISADLMLMRKMPCNRSAAVALCFLRM